MSSGQTQDQLRAAHAWKVVQDVKREDKLVQKEFKIQAKKLPARIVTSGLGQALAFLEAKGYARHLRAGLDNWVRLPGGSQPARQERRLFADRPWFFRRSSVRHGRSLGLPHLAREVH